jgi:hypothetical protein
MGFYRVAIVEINSPDRFWAAASAVQSANPSTNPVNDFND